MKGISKTKFIKGTDIPKRAGNFSPCTMRWETRSYPVHMIDGELIVGNSTPLRNVMGAYVEQMVLHDPFFDSVTLKGKHTFNGKQYEAEKLLTRSRFGKMYDFAYREGIDTEKEFKYIFPEY